MSKEDSITRVEFDALVKRVDAWWEDIEHSRACIDEMIEQVDVLEQQVKALDVLKKDLESRQGSSVDPGVLVTDPDGDPPKFTVCGYTT